MPQNLPAATRMVLMTKIPSSLPKNKLPSIFHLNKLVLASHRMPSCTQAICPSNSSKLWRTRITLRNNNAAADIRCHHKEVCHNSIRIKHNQERSTHTKRIERVFQTDTRPILREDPLHVLRFSSSTPLLSDRWCLVSFGHLRYFGFPSPLSDK